MKYEVSYVTGKVETIESDRVEAYGEWVKFGGAQHTIALIRASTVLSVKVFAE